MGGKIEGAAKGDDLSKCKGIESSLQSVQVKSSFKKLVCAVAAGLFLGFGIKSAKKYIGLLHPDEYKKLHFNTGIYFASRALTISTLITVSGYALFVIGVSALFNVNSPRQFGDKMQHLFGNKFRLEKRRSLENCSEVPQDLKK